MGGEREPPASTGSEPHPTGRVESLWIAKESGARPEPRDSVEVHADGVEGDRYQLGGGHFQLDVCPVTLVASEAVEAVRAETGIDVSDGRHRRNIVVEGFGAGMDDLLEATIAVGNTLLRPTRRRPPCAHLEELADADGLASALKHRGGLCCDVIEPGRVAVGDSVSIRNADPRTAGAEIADRLRERSNTEPTNGAGDRASGRDQPHGR